MIDKAPLTAQAIHGAFADVFEPAGGLETVSVPGRVNLIGEHIDYHDLPVLPIAIDRRTSLVYRPRTDNTVRAASPAHPEVVFSLDAPFELAPFGRWENYIRAAAQIANTHWVSRTGIDALVSSNLPQAAGLSSSSALLIGFTLALLRAAGNNPSMPELLDVLPDGEQLVGTRGGGMDHAAVLAAKAGCALLIEFAPLQLTHLPVPEDWSFLVAHSLTKAEKSGPVLGEYNLRKTAGVDAIRKLGFASYRAALAQQSSVALLEMAARQFEDEQLSDVEFRCLTHVVSENERVREAVAALRSADLPLFGRLMNASHASLRDYLRVSNVALDELVETALEAGASGARVTGAGFGGCAVILCPRSERATLEERLIAGFYSKRPAFRRDEHLIVTEPSAGALSA